MTIGSLALYIVPNIYNSISEDNCRSKGGDWKITGQDLKYRCRIPSADANKTCTDGSQCFYGICTGGIYGQTSPITGNCIKYKEESSRYGNQQQGIAPLVILY